MYKRTLLYSIIVRIRTYFSKRKIQNDIKQNGFWSDLVLDFTTGKTITEKGYLDKYGKILTDDEAKEIVLKIIGCLNTDKIMHSKNLKK